MLFLELLETYPTYSAMFPVINNDGKQKLETKYFRFSSQGKLRSDKDPYSLFGEYGEYKKLKTDINKPSRFTGNKDIEWIKAFTVKFDSKTLQPKIEYNRDLLSRDISQKLYTSTDPDFVPINGNAITSCKVEQFTNCAITEILKNYYLQKAQWDQSILVALEIVNATVLKIDNNNGIASASLSEFLSSDSQLSGKELFELMSNIYDRLIKADIPINPLRLVEFQHAKKVLASLEPATETKQLTQAKK